METLTVEENAQLVASHNANNKEEAPPLPDKLELSKSATHTFCSGAKYVGQFKGGKFHGQGVYTFPGTVGAFSNAVERYEGQWENGKMHGDGLYCDGGGVKFKGEFFGGRYNNGRGYVSLR